MLTEKREKNSEDNLKFKYFVDDNGLKQGKLTEYYRNGNVFYEIYYEDDKKHGNVFIYNQDGSIRQSGEYRNDKKKRLLDFYT